MRYRSLASRQALLAQDGSAKYTFKNYSLIVGTPTGTGAGNEIVPDLAGTDPASAMQELYPAGGTDLQKVGKDTLFIEAPPITAAGTLADTLYYELIEGSADLSDAAYVGNYAVVLPQNYCGTKAGPGLIIKVDNVAGITVPADGSTWALTFSPAYLTEEEFDYRCEYFKINNLSAYKDESAWDPTTWDAIQKDVAYTRG